MSKYHVLPGALIVLEGLDKAGKSTQLSELSRWLAPGSYIRAHMPSGFTDFTREIYNLLEHRDTQPANALATQLAHLACHAESLPHIRAALTGTGVILDRWWWSTAAYGWGGGGVVESGISETAYRNLITSIWTNIEASVVFLFDEPHEPDPNNLDGIRPYYHKLSDEDPERAIRVPSGGTESVTTFILEELLRRGLLSEEGNLSR